MRLRRLSVLKPSLAEIGKTSALGQNAAPAFGEIFEFLLFLYEVNLVDDEEHRYLFFGNLREKVGIFEGLQPHR